jgi:catalase
MTKPQTKMEQVDPLSRDALQAFDDLFGLHPGFRPTHAKGILLSGSFTPAAGVGALTKAPHVNRPSIRIGVRFSDFGGIPTVPDYDENASPRGFAIRFYLAEHEHTDIIAHSVNAFPTRTAEEFVELIRAIHASGPGTPKPTPIDSFLSSHPTALAFVQAPKPIPTSFAKESFYSVSAYKFTNGEGVSNFGRYRIVPTERSEYFEPAEAAKQHPNFLFDEIKDRIAHGPVKMRILVQVASDGETVDAQRQIIFDPIPRVDGIESSGDPLLNPRASVYLASGHRRRAATV